MGFPPPTNRKQQQNLFVFVSPFCLWDFLFEFSSSMPNNPDLPVVMDAALPDGPPEQPAAPGQAGGQNIVDLEDDDNAEDEADVNLLGDQEGNNGRQVVEAPANNGAAEAGGGAEAGGRVLLLPCQVHPTKRKIANTSWMNDFNWLRQETADGHTHHARHAGGRHACQ